MIQAGTRIVLDTNVFLVSIPTRSRYHPIFQAFLDNQFTLCVTTEILTEYDEILSQRANVSIAANALETIDSAANVVWITRYFAWQLIDIDPDDNKFVDCAIASNADFIVTNDHHFDILQRITFPKVDVIDIDNFLTMLTTD